MPDEEDEKYESADTGDEESEEEGDEEKKEEKRARYVCEICSTMYKEKGMCPNCDIVLKKKGE
ncbi:MAG: hypothetical protein HYS81_01110 [Candidatus Aenigmatarchaeota archaeon]|nr:MAG: hypothetical protein HYS81_01110 [Candidatus Aenigmarchaeota archaeon]